MEVNLHFFANRKDPILDSQFCLAFFTVNIQHDPIISLEMLICIFCINS